MGVLIVDVENHVEEQFRKIVEKRYGKGEYAVEAVVNHVLKQWAEGQSPLPQT